MKRKVVLSAILLLLSVQSSNADSIFGIVKNNEGRVMPGITISLVHEKLGRSSSSITDGAGKYIISALPNDNKFYIEAHWGKELIYRKPIVISGNMRTDIKIQ